jgi:hypothetical protein
MFGSKRVTVAGRGDLHGESGRVTGKTEVAGTKYAKVLLDGEGHHRLIPPGNLTRKKRR